MSSPETPKPAAPVIDQRPELYATYEPFNEHWDFYDTERGAIAGLERMADGMLDQRDQDEDHFTDETGKAAAYALYPIATLNEEAEIVRAEAPVDLTAEVAQLRAERQAILDAGGDALWAGGAKTIPEAVAGVLHALDVELRRSDRERACGLDPDEMVGSDGEEGDDRNIIRLRGEDCPTDDDAGGGWSIDGADGYEPTIGTGTTWDTAEDAMAAHPGKWWMEEPGCWMCSADELDKEGEE